MNSLIFYGGVRHRRFIKAQHAFSYKLCMLYLDLDKLDSLFDHYWLWSSQGFNMFAFKRAKYLGSKNETLATSVRKLLREKGRQSPDKIFLLTNLAYYGYCFNPISLYFCFNKGELRHCIVEVTNTPWNEQKAYVLTPTHLKNNTYSMRFKKTLHVSPFLTMDYDYRLKCKHSAERIVVHIENWRNNQCHFDATLSLQAKPITHANLAKLALRFPLMSWKIIAAIHWESLKLYLKRTPIVYHPEKQHD